MHTGDCWDTRTRCEAATTDADRDALAEESPRARTAAHTPRARHPRLHRDLP
ncbi:hypothetical protein [Streptomyces sp. NPDC054901]